MKPSELLDKPEKWTQGAFGGRSVMNTTLPATQFQLVTPATNPSMVTLLAAVGLPQYRAPHNKTRRDYAGSRGFWLRHEVEFPEILVDAHRNYRRLCKQLHPDLPGGNADAMLSWNDSVGRTFREVRKLIIKADV